MVFPTSCICGTVLLFRFSSFSGMGYFECFCNEIQLQYGYARAFCCDNISNLIYDPIINDKILKLHQVHNP